MVAANDLPAGTVVLVAKPIAMIMDWEDDVVVQDDGANAGEAMIQGNKQRPWRCTRRWCGSNGGCRGKRRDTAY